jgi:hypothetical protein
VKELIASDKWKWRIAIAVVVAVTVIEYGPVFLSGRIPFPATIVNGFPAYFDEFPQGPQKPLANIGHIVTTFYPYHALAERDAWALGLVLQRLLAVIFTLLLLRELGGTPAGRWSPRCYSAFQDF